MKRLHAYLVPLFTYFAENNLGAWVGTWLFTVLKVSDLFYVGLESDVPARICKCVLSDTNRRKKGWWFINRRIEPRMKMDYLSSVLINKTERIEVREIRMFGTKISKDWVEIRLLACFTKLLSRTQNRPLWLFHSSQRKTVLCFFFGPSNIWTFGKISRNFIWIQYNWRPLLLM